MKITNLSVCLALLACPLAVFGTPETDRRIEAAAKASYNYRTVLEDTVKVKASDGVVTLTGTVSDQDAKNLAADTVENLPGVTSVKNNLQIKSAHPEHSDAWIAMKVRSHLLVKGHVSATQTKVTTQDGVVTLTGSADNFAQKDLTGLYAQDVEGVKSVRNELNVMDVLGVDRTIGEKIDDASITSQVKYALLTHKGTSALKTKVTTFEGVIAISGEATSDVQKALVSKLAQDVRGASSVNNQMTVKS